MPSALLKKFCKKSPDRIKAECPAAERCGGCCFAHISYEAELKIKYNQVADNFRRLGGMEVKLNEIIPSPQASRYRNKAQYPVGSDGSATQIGFYAPMSHRIIDCGDCRLQPEEFSSIIDVFRQCIAEDKISVYDERSGTGLLRHIYLRKSFATGDIMVCAVTNGREFPQAERLVARLTEEMPSVKGIVQNVNTKNTNVVLGGECITLWGSGFITDKLCGLTFNISPLSFYQVNHDAAEILYAKAAEYAALTGEETLLDLYCGTGTIGLTMASKAKKLIGIEVVPQAVENAIENARLNKIDNAEFICADAAQAVGDFSPDVVIIDPPRKGCDEALPGIICKMSPKRIVYVSCDSATLARDCARFAQLGYTVAEATPVDMFPRTGNVETVVLLSRKQERTNEENID